MQNEIQDYVPFMDKYPELNLRPVTEFSNHSKISNYDYVQNLNLKGKKAPHGYFYLTVMNEKYGIYMCDRGFMQDITSIVLQPEYEQIDFLYYKEKSLGIIVKRDGKYGMFFWTYGFFSNETHVVKCEYDVFDRMDGGRFKAIKDNIVTYFDSTGHILK